MKKKALSLLLTLTMLLSLVPAFGTAASAAIGTELTADFDDIANSLKSGNYYLSGNLTLEGYNIYINDGAIVTIDLNGYVLCGNGSQDNAVITNRGNLTIKDSRPSVTRYFTDNSSPKDGCYETCSDTETAGSIKVTGGCITGSIKSGIVNSGTLTMEGGNIIGNSTTGQCGGGGVFNSGTKATFTMKGGNIISNLSSGKGGGGVYVNTGSFIMKSGTISHNTASASGGGMYVAATNFTMTGGIITANTAGENGGGVYYDSSCFIAGTQITMADGSTKNIEDVAVGELVKSFNHETGKFESSKVTIAYEGSHAAPYFTLHFTNDIELSICGLHDLFERSAMRYVTVSEANCESMVGKEFYCAETGTWEKLLSVTRPNDTARYYSLYVAKTVNCLANGMLSVPDDIDNVPNVFTFNADLTVNQAALQADIETYGLCTMADFPYIDSQEEFDALNCKYVNIMVGKGMVTREEAEAAYREWYAGDENEPSVLTAKSVQNDAPQTLTASLAHYGTATTNTNVTLGGTAKIVGNTDSNLYLAASNTWPSISTSLTTGASIGVTREDDNGIGKFTSGTAIEADLPYFFSDNENYGVKYVSEDESSGHLELVAIPTEAKNTEYKVSLTVQENIDINLYVRPQNATEELMDSYSVKATFNGETSNCQLSSFNNNEGKYIVANVYSYEMTKPVRISVFYADDNDTILVKSIEYSVRDYFMYQLEHDSATGDSGTNTLANRKALYLAALDYGAEAQKYFNDKTYEESIPYDVNIGSLANAGTSSYGRTGFAAAIPNVGIVYSSTITGLDLYCSIIHGSETSLKFYMEDSACSSLEDFTAKYTVTDGTNPLTMKYEENQLASVKFTGISADKLGRNCTLHITQTGTSNTLTLGYSPYAHMSDMYSRNEDRSFYLAMYNYGLMAATLWSSN